MRVMQKAQTTAFTQTHNQKHINEWPLNRQLSPKGPVGVSVICDHAKESLYPIFVWAVICDQIGVSLICDHKGLSLYVVYVWAVINDHRCFCDLWSLFVSSSMSEPLSWVWLPPGVHGLFVQDCAPSDMRNMYLMCWSLKWWLRDGCVIVLLIGGRLWILRFSAILTSL